jgi:hypothetical protein
MRPVNRGTWVVAVLAVPTVCAALVFVSGACAFVSRATHPAQWVPTFQESFDPKPLLAKYEKQLAPCRASTTSTRDGLLHSVRKTKTITFDESAVSEAQASQALAQLQTDLVELARSAGVEFHGKMATDVENGVLRRFEFAYSHRGADGFVRGTISPVEGARWKLECIVGESR